jgi:hypothetical protein
MVQTTLSSPWQDLVSNLFFRGKIFLQCRYHRGGSRLWRLDLQDQPGFFGSPAGIGAESTDQRAVLLEMWEIIEKAFYSAGCEKADNIKCIRAERLTYIIADRPVHIRSSELTMIAF